MAAAAELGQYLADMHLRDARTADHEDAALHAHRQDEHVEVLHVLELVGENGDIADIVSGGGMGDAHVDAVDIDRLHRVDELFEQCHLVAGQLLDQGVGDGIEVGAATEQEGARLVVAAGGGVEEQAAGVLVEAEHHDRRLFGARFDAALHEEVAENGHRRTDRFDHLDIALQV